MKVSKHIAIDIRMAFSSGIGTYIRRLLPTLFTARPADSFTLIGHARDWERLGWSGFANVSFRPVKAPIYSVEQQWEVWRSIPANVDLLWSPHYDIPLLYRGRLLVTVHDVAHLALTDLYKGVKRAYARLMFWALRRQADFIMCDSEFSRQEMIRLTGCGKDNSTTIHLGVDDFWFTPPTASFAAPGPYLVYVGNVKPHKNLRGLLAAFAQVKDDIPHDLVIVGKREGFITGDEVVQRAEAEFAGRVRFTGFISDEELKACIAGAAGLVLPSFYEGFGLPPLEAMACSCPTLVSRAGSLPEICADGSLYCDPHDPADIAAQIRVLVGDEAVRARLRRDGLARARALRWEACTAQVLDVLERCLA